MNSALIELVDSLSRLPGIGKKSAARMAYHLLQHDRNTMQLIAQNLLRAQQQIRHCQLCHTFTEEEICAVCSDPNRDRTKLCVVETPADQAALERTGAYRGLYYVLMGKLSPLDGIGPKDIGLQQLFSRIDSQVQEVILATNFTAEGETTAHVISEVLKTNGVKVTRLARGVPIGSELEYVDLSTIAHALVDRH